MQRPVSSLLDGEAFYLELLGPYEFAILEGEKDLSGTTHFEASWMDPPHDLRERTALLDQVTIENTYRIAAIAVERGLKVFEERLFDWLEKHA